MVVAWRRHRLQVLFPVLLGVLILLVMIAPLVFGEDPDAIALGRKLTPPGQSNILGTDHLGRDVFSRTIHGGYNALSISLISVATSLSLAILLGVLAGYYGGQIDAVISAVLDVLLTLPGLLVALAVLGILGTNRVSLVIALVGASWASEARIIRSTVSSIKSSGYIDAAYVLGASDLWILRRHVVPNTASILLVLGSLDLAEILLVVSGLSFLGLGAQPPQADWGTMLADGRPFLGEAPWLMLAPGVCIVLYSLLANLSGDSLRSIFDPRVAR
jgi:peptide/nickel transport system permease protein